MSADFQVTALESGVRVISSKMSGLEMVCVNAAISVGSCHEESFEHGVAHFLEHMIFQGTQERSADVIKQAASRLGAKLDAWTDWDTTTFRAHVLRENVSQAVELLAEIMLLPALGQDDVKKECGIILREIDERNSSWNVLNEGFYEAAFGDQSLARPIIGSQESVVEIDAKLLRAFHEKYYLTQNLAVCMVGDVDHAEAVDIVSVAFEHCPEGRQSTMPVAEYFGGEAQFACNCDAGMVLLGYPFPPDMDRKATAADLFREILGGGPDSRLFKELREKRGLVYGTSTYTNYHINRPLLVMEANGHANSVNELFQIMYEQAHEAAHNVTQDELELAKINTIATIRMDCDLPYRQCSDAIFKLFETGKIPLLQDEIAVIEKIDLDYLKACAQELLADPPTLAAHGPVRHMPKLRQVQSLSSGRKVA